MGRVQRPARGLPDRPRSSSAPRPRAARRPPGDRDLRSLVGLWPPTRRAPPDLLGAPAARLPGPRRRSRRRARVRTGGPADLHAALLGLGELPAQRRTARATAPRSAAAPSVQADPAPLRGQGTAPQVHARDGAQPAQGLAGALDLRRPSRRGADQQPRRARAARRGHLPQAQPRQPIRARERRIERLLSASTTCRLQRRSLFDYLTDLLAAHARDDPVPLLA